MKELASPIRSPRPRVLVALAAVMFVVITALRLWVTLPGFGFALLYDVPVALVAVAFGFRAGMAAAAVGMALFALGDATRPVHAGGMAIHTNEVGYAARAVVFFLLGGLLGLLSDRLRRSEQVLGGVLESAHDAIVTADGSGRIVAFNRAAELAFGLPASAALGKPLTILLAGRYRAAHEAGLRRYLETGEWHVIGSTVELAGRRGDGSEFPLELSLAAFELRGETFFTEILADITERKRAEEATRHVAAVLEQSPDAVLAKDSNGLITEWNAGAERVYGYSSAEALGRPIGDLIIRKDRLAEERDILARILRGETVEMYETLRRRKDGSAVEVEVTITPLRDEQGGIAGASSIARDIGERRRAERKFRDLLESAPDAMVIVDERGAIQLVNAQAERLFRYPREKLLGESVEILVPERLRGARPDPSTDLLRELPTRPLEVGLELFAVRSDGTEFPVEISLSPLESEEGILVSAAIRNVTERKRQESYRAAQHEVSSVLVEAESAQEGVAQVAQALAERLQWDWGASWAVDEERGRIHCETIWHEPSLDVAPLVRATRKAEFPFGTGLPGRAWASGAVEWIDDLVEERGISRSQAAAEVGLHSAVAVPLRRSGKVVGVLELLCREARPPDDALVDTMAVIGDKVGLFLDRKRAEAQIAEQAALLDLAHDAIIVREPSESRITYWNREAEEIYGYRAAEALGNVTHELLATAFPEPLSAIDAALRERDRWEGELMHRRRDGRAIIVASRQALYRRADGEPVAIIELNSDISVRKRMERQQAEYRASLERSNAELEQFAYVASHDLQEPLRTIGGFVQLLQRRYQDELDEDAERFIGFIVDGAARMQALIDDLLSYSRAGERELRRERIETSELLDRTLTSLDAAVREAGADVELGELPLVNADPKALLQVFQNLLSNSLKFTDGQPPHVEVTADHDDGSWSFAVADNGIGIDPGHTERIFRMFQRLHARDEYGGTGIGLAICKRLVERHGGRIWCEPRLGGGTVFHFTIPDSEEAVV